MNKSFLKWAGGKSQLVEKIKSLMPEKNSGRYIEPFVGSGVVALNVDFPEIIIGDISPSLITLWNQIKDDAQIVSRCRTYFTSSYNTESWYYALRDEFNVGRPNNGHLFLYLNRHCFNGLCRFNAKGKFNVPYGKYKKVYFPEKELKHAAEVAKRMKIFWTTFFDLMIMADRGDVVYCDPPYLPISETSNFTGYSKEGFSLTEQRTLALEARQASERGATVIISNNAVPIHKELYADATELHYVDVRKAISCKSDGRKKLQEVLAVYRP